MRIFPRKYLFNPLSIAIAAVLLFTPVYLLVTPKYKLNIVDHQQNNRKTYYFDINSDGISEKIDYYGYILSDNFKRTTVILRTQDNSIQGIWNHNGRFILYSEPIITDFDDDSIGEIFTFHRRKDSLFLNGINPTKEDKFFIKDRFIDKSRFVNGTVNLQIQGVSTVDLNKDNFKELVFTINAGFSLQPRNVYIYDVKNDSLWKSAETYSRLTGPHVVPADIDKDDHLEYILQTHASANLTDLQVPFPDDRSYLMILNEDLEFLFQPIEFHASLSVLYAYPVILDKKIHIMSYLRSNKNRKEDSLFLYNHKGKRLAEKDLRREASLIIFPTNYSGQQQTLIMKTPDVLYNNGQVVTYDKNLKVTNRKKLPIKKVKYLLPTTISTNSQPGFAIVSEHQVSITDQNYNIFAQVEIDNTSGLRHLSFIQRGKSKRPYYYLQGSAKQYILDLHLNVFYAYWWLVILIAGITIFLLAYLIKTITTLVNEYNMSKILTERESHKTQLARELHDELGSRITGLRLKIANLQQDKFQNDLDELSVDLQKTHEEVRSIIYNLAPPQIAGNSFYNLIKQLADNYTTLNSFHIKIECLPDYNIFDKLDDFVQKELYRVVQEALNNSAKHSRASEVIIQFFKRENILELFVDDNGVGFETENTFNRIKGQGIKSMETRIKMLKGHFYIYSAQNKGTGIAIQIPIKANKNGRGKLFSFISRRPQYYYRRD